MSEDQFEALKQWITSMIIWNCAVMLGSNAKTVKAADEVLKRVEARTKEKLVK